MDNVLNMNLQSTTPVVFSGHDENRIFENLYKRYWNPLLNYSAHYLKDKETCEELVQDLFVQLHAKKSSLVIKSSLSSYLYTALRNRIFNHFRDRAVYHKHVSNAAASLPGSQNNVEQLLNYKELQKAISCYLPQLPVKCRQVYILRDHDLLPVRKIAQLLNRPLNTVEKQLRKANQLLRVYLEGNEWKDKTIGRKMKPVVVNPDQEVPQKMAEVSQINGYDLADEDRLECHGIASGFSKAGRKYKNHCLRLKNNV